MFDCEELRTSHYILYFQLVNSCGKIMKYETDYSGAEYNMD